MTETVTSTGQVYKILDQALSQNTTYSIDAWAETFGISSTDTKQIRRKITKFFILFDNAKEEITCLNEPYSNIGLDALDKVETIISDNLFNSSWSTVTSKLQQDTLNIISLCDGLLKNEKHGYLKISESKVKELKTQVDNLIDEFINSNLPNDLKQDLIAELRKIQDKLINFQILGEACLQQICEEVQANILRKALIQPKLFKEFIPSVLKVVNLAVTIGGLMTAYDLSLKYQPLLADQIINLIENIPDPTNNTNLKLEAGAEIQEMQAQLDTASNHKYLPSGEEE